MVASSAGQLKVRTLLLVLVCLRIVSQVYGGIYTQQPTTQLILLSVELPAANWDLRCILLLRRSIPHKPNSSAEEPSMDHHNLLSSQSPPPNSGATTYTNSVTEADQETAKKNERQNSSRPSSMSGKGPGGLVSRSTYFVRYFLRNSKISASAD